MKKLSVIIPMYNSSEFIEEAVNSVLVQKDIDIEVIVVDDGSTDNSCSKLAKYGNEICLLHKENGGASSARNFGLRKCTGEYVMFLDADDYIDDCNICSRCIKLLNKNGYDFSMFRLKYLNNETKSIIRLPNYPTSIRTVSDSSRIIEILVRNGIFPASPCFKILKKSFLLKNNLFFEEGVVAEDIEWFVRVLISSNSFGVLDDDAYVYRKGINTSVTGGMTISKCYDLFHAISKSVNEINKQESVAFKQALLSAMGYEYCILLGNAYLINDKKLMSDVKKSIYLLGYSSFPKIKLVYLIYRIFGFGVLARALGFYIKNNAKSNV